jgi:hypothetical protein
MSTVSAHVHTHHDVAQGVDMDKLIATSDWVSSKVLKRAAISRVTQATLAKMSG